MSFVLLVDIRIKPENVERFMKELGDNARAARQEPGCRQFEVLVEPKDRTQVVLFEVYDDEFRETLKREPPFAERRFDWMLDVDPDAPHGTRGEIVRPEPMPVPERHGGGAPALTLEAAVEALRGREDYRVIRTSDPR